MCTCYVMCGIPGSGKTTLAKEIAKQYSVIVHSYDDIPNAWGNPDRDGSLYKQWLNNIRHDLQNGNSVVCDSTALSSINRKQFLEEISDFDCEKILIVKAVPLEICIQRNKGRFREVPENQIELSARLLEPPTEDEGWDAIYISRD